MKRDPATKWQAEAFRWLAVALAPRDRARANALIDRALGMMIDRRDWANRSAWSGGEMAGAAHVALCAPDRLSRHAERHHAGDRGPTHRRPQRVQ